MESAAKSQIQDKIVCTSLHANALRKGMNPSVLAWLLLDSRKDFNLGLVTSLGKSKF